MERLHKITKLLVLAATLVCVNAQIGRGFFTAAGGAADEPTEIGTIFSDDFVRADNAAVGNSWIEEASVNSAIVSNKLRLVGSGSQVHRVRQPILTSGENFTMSIRFTMTTLDATSYGPLVGTIVRTSEIASGTQRGYCAQLGTATGSNLGKILLENWNGTTFSIVATGGSTLTYSGGDEVELSLTMDQFTVTARAENLTQGGEISVSSTLSTTSGNIIPGPRDPTIFIAGGTCDVSEFSWVNNATTGADIVFIGDSITHGASASALANRWSSLVASGIGGTCFNYAAASAITGNMVSSISEIVAYAPEKVVMMIGGNDILAGVVSGTWQANYASIVSSLEGAGIEVWHCLPTPRDATNVSAVKDWINSTYSGTGRVIDTWTPLNDSGTSLNETYDSGDNVHPNDAGHDLIADTVIAALTP